MYKQTNFGSIFKENPFKYFLVFLDTISFQKVEKEDDAMTVLKFYIILHYKHFLDVFRLFETQIFYIKYIIHCN